MGEVSRRSLLRGSMAAPALAQSTPARRPNLIFLISDDHSYPDLGVLGSPVATPHLDRIAREGLRFENTFVTSAQCSPNRSSILTGSLSDWMHDTSDYLPPCYPRPGQPAGRHWPMSL